MCGIVGAIAQRDISPILLEGLKRLEYRGYDSAGVAIINPKTHEIERVRVHGKVAKLEEALEATPLLGSLGIAHTRWATHGIPSEANAHPHISGNEIAIVHNGIIENHAELRQKLMGEGYQFLSETDTEVIVHLLHHHLKKTPDLIEAIYLSTLELEGAYALGIISAKNPQDLFAVRRGSPLVIGLGLGENFIASDPLALLSVTQKFIYLEEGDIAHLSTKKIHIFDKDKKSVERKIHYSKATADSANKGEYRHFMLKEIFEQAESLTNTINGHLVNDKLIANAFGHKATSIFPKIKRIQIVACGTSFHAASVARYWLESHANLPCNVEIASENRYRKIIVEPDTLFVALSQSGETADTLAALRRAKTAGYFATLGICNVPESSLTRESDLVFLTRAGAEIGVAATKTFTAQLMALLMLTGVMGKLNGMSDEDSLSLIRSIEQLPALVNTTLLLNDKIKAISHYFLNKNDALFLGRGDNYPIAMEGALKLKEISYMHAEAYPAGELKHGPLALVDKDMPVIVLAPKNSLFEKLESNVHEVQARGGDLYIFTDCPEKWKANDKCHLITMPSVPHWLEPIIYTIPMQLLAYYVAVLKGTDVDQPRNLAKSVTVE
jgi:glucosamine--fructose-6-phosphate aminotransferase (isomerizing)